MVFSRRRLRISAGIDPLSTSSSASSARAPTDSSATEDERVASADSSSNAVMSTDNSVVGNSSSIPPELTDNSAAIGDNGTAATPSGLGSTTGSSDTTNSAVTSLTASPNSSISGETSPRSSDTTTDSQISTNAVIVVVGNSTNNEGKAVIIVPANETNVWNELFPNGTNAQIIQQPNSGLGSNNNEVFILVPAEQDDSHSFSSSGSTSPSSSGSIDGSSLASSSSDITFPPQTSTAPVPTMDTVSNGSSDWLVWTLIVASVLIVALIFAVVYRRHRRKMSSLFRDTSSGEMSAAPLTGRRIDRPSLLSWSSDVMQFDWREVESSPQATNTATAISTAPRRVRFHSNTEPVILYDGDL